MKQDLFSPAAEHLSALMDGQLHGAALDEALQACEDDEALLHRWRNYHLIGDVLRGVPPVVGADEERFVNQLRHRLAQSPKAEPEPQTWRPPAPVETFESARMRQEAANEPRYRWRWAAGFATVALAAGLTWTMVEGRHDQEAAVAGVDAATVLVAGPQGVVMRDAALEELMEAHRQQGGASVLPMPSGFLRNATFEASPALMARAAPNR